MSDQASLDAFLGKWQARWPEWRVAAVFVPTPQRAATQAWLALRQELADAAWDGADPRPGAAKLAWWSDELDGWANGRRRHPLGLALQRVAAPWEALASSLPALAAARELPVAAGDAPAVLHATLAPVAAAGDRVSAAIAGAAAAPSTPSSVVPGAGSAIDAPGAIGASLAAARALSGQGVPALADALLRAPSARPAGTRADRIFAALAHERLRAFRARGGAGNPAPSYWHALWVAWRAGRSVPLA